MSEKIYAVPAEWAKRALSTTRSTRRCTRARSNDPDGFWGEHGKRIDWIKPFTKVKNTQLRARQCLDQVVRGRHAQRLGQLPRPPPRQARRPGRDHLGRRRSRPSRRKITYRELHERGLPLRQRAARRAASRRATASRIYLPMIPEAAYRDAGLRPHRRDPFGRVRRLLARRARRPHPGLRHRKLRDHRRRGPARRPQGAAEGQCRRGAEQVPARRDGARGASAPAATVDMEAGRDVWYDEAAASVSRRLPARADERRRPAVHPLHLRLDRQAQGRAAHHRRLSGLRLDDAPVRLRLPRRRHLLVHRRRRLGHRPQLHRLRPARQRRDHADVRGRAELSRRIAASGRWSTSTRSTSSTPRRPPSAR